MDNQINEIDCSDETKDKLVIFKIYNNPQLLEIVKRNVIISKNLSSLFDFFNEEYKVCWKFYV